jgi:hypothetical protein
MHHPPRSSVIKDDNFLPEYLIVALRRALLFVEPFFEDGEDVTLLSVVERAALLNPVPFLEAAAAAGGRGVLGDEGRVVAHGRLLAVVGGVGCREALVYEVGGVFEHDTQALRAQVRQLLPAQTEAPSELRRAERREEFFHVAHKSSHRLPVLGGGS